jgi:S-(hydroxymethyl)glutathione dehydrogenase/alcohol dehydrogenase
VKTQAVVCSTAGDEWELTELDLDPPRSGEVLVRVAYAGLCYSDEHTRKGTQNPKVGGHEASGVVEAVGEGVTRVAVGDHVVFSVIPSCGTCRWCVSGQSYICDLGASIGTGQLPDGTFRFHRDGVDYGGGMCLGAFSERTVVSQHSCVRIDTDIPLDVAAIVGCSVPTGWGSAVNAADVRPGEVVCVVGSGGVGVNAVQGAALAGAKTIVVFDPLQMKVDFALRMGAHYGFVDAAEGMNFLRGHTGGVMADKVIECVDILSPETTRLCFDATRKGGTLVLTGLADFMTDISVQLSGSVLTLFAKRIVGTLYGNCNAYADIPRLLNLYRAGRLRLDEVITKRYPLSGVAEGYRDVAAGSVIRGVLAINPE